MIQTALQFDPYPPSKWDHNSQRARLYRRLQAGPVTNAEIVREMGIFNSTGRASEIRAFLQEHGLTRKCRALGNGIFEYRIGR